MSDLIDETANYVLDLASPQRLSILFILSAKNSTPTEIAKKLDSTKQEVHRNFTRLVESGLIQKNLDGKYSLTTLWRGCMYSNSNIGISLPEQKIL